jgi:hypothetical protein
MSKRDGGSVGEFLGVIQWTVTRSKVVANG